MSKNEVMIHAECDACGATGVYQGFCEAEGEAVVCVRCDGTGRAKLYYTPFTARKNRRGVETVRRSRGALIATGVGPVGGSVTYAQFKKGQMP